MSPKPDVSTERKAQILAAAIRIFTRKGLEATRMEEIAQEAGLSVGGVYWYFKSKDEVILAILDGFIQMDVETVNQLQQAAEPALERLHQFLQTDMPLLLQVYPLIYELYGLAQRDERLCQRANAYQQAYRQALAEFLTQAVARGELHPHNIQLTSLTLAALSQGLFDLTMFNPAGLDVTQTLRDMVNLVLANLRCDNLA